jgi:hypothetical protein
LVKRKKDVVLELHLVQALDLATQTKTFDLVALHDPEEVLASKRMVAVLEVLLHSVIRSVKGETGFETLQLTVQSSDLVLD